MKNEFQNGTRFISVHPRFRLAECSYSNTIARLYVGTFPALKMVVKGVIFHEYLKPRKKYSGLENPKISGSTGGGGGHSREGWYWGGGGRLYQIINTCH